MIFLLIIISVTLITGSNILFYISLKKIFSKNIIQDTYLNFSIVIALKNEEQNVESLIDSLDSINYPGECYEVILVDDNSTDNTFCTLKGIAGEKPNYKILKAGQKMLPAKKGALSIGIGNAKYNYIMITDADCRPSAGWLNAFNNKFQLGFDLIFGIAPFFHDDLIISRISCFENLRSSILIFALAGLKIPYSATARSLGFKKESFYKIGGYTNTIDTISGDDDLLIREAVKNNLKVGTAIDSEAFVYSRAKNNIKEYLGQKSRHTSTSIYYLLQHKIILAAWHIINILSLPLLIAAFFYPILFLIPAIKFLFDFLMIISFSKKFGYSFSLTETFYLQCCYETFLIINFINALRNKTDWE